MKTYKYLLLLIFLLGMGKTTAATFTIEAENMTLSGKYAGTITSPFSGIALYANDDKGTITQPFPDGAGIYTISVVGASSNTSAAGVSLYLDGTKVKAFSFTGTASTTSSIELKLPSIGQSVKVELILETDNGNNDTFIDKITITYNGAIPPPKTPPALISQGAFYTGVHRNVFKESGITETAINERINTLWSQFFYGNADTQALYYPVGTDEAYILDTGNSDVRSEGMSYGMMICVQMDKQTEFNRLWKWAKTHMYQPDGQYKGYFAWQRNPNGTEAGDKTPASDGEEYFITALMFASNRWGDGTGIYNYKTEANAILSACQDRVVQSGGVTKLFDETEKQVVFCPISSSAKFTDPSYHLPAFYELWSRWATDASKRTFWTAVAAKSREMWPKFANATTGLMPDYANFDGSAHNGDGDHGDFYYDAWRCAMNMAVDYAWFKPVGSSTGFDTEQALINRLHNFFASKGVDSYGALYRLNGTLRENNSDAGAHSPGLVACNAAGMLASNQSVAWDFVEDFFRTGIPTGKYRYYDGLLYFLNFLHLSGNFKIYYPAGEAPIVSDPEPKPEPGNTTALETAKVHPAGYTYSSNTLSLANGVAGQIAIYDVKGQLQLSVFNVSVMDISLLPAGLYIVKIQQQGETYTGKIVK